MRSCLCKWEIPISTAIIGESPLSHSDSLALTLPGAVTKVFLHLDPLSRSTRHRPEQTLSLRPLQLSRSPRYFTRRTCRTIPQALLAPLPPPQWATRPTPRRYLITLDHLTRPPRALPRGRHTRTRSPQLPPHTAHRDIRTIFATLLWLWH